MTKNIIPGFGQAGVAASAAVVAFCDVDDSLITTTRVSPCEGAEPCAVDDKGLVCGYLSPKQRVLNQLLAASAQVVLTTARSSKGLKNVQLPVSGGAYAIVSFGGVILTPAGCPEPRWHQRMSEGSGLYAALLDELCAHIKDVAAEKNIDVRVRVVVDAGLPLYVSVKHNQKNLFELCTIKAAAESFLQEHHPAAARQQMFTHFNGNFLAFLPPFLRKEDAVRWFMENVAAPGALSIGLGDSESDLPFMSLCDYVLMPSRSQAFAGLRR